MNNGDLMGYRVGGGVINFLGAGLDTANSNYTDVIARAVNVNAGLWAQNLNIITGSNQVNVASNGDVTGITTISPNATLPDGSSNPSPGFAIDVAALGGMYAGKIHLTGTEAGVGVRNAGSIGASVGEVTIDVNGMLTNTSTGHLTSVGNTQLTATGGISNQGTIYAQGNTTLTTSGNLINSGTVAATGNIKMNSASLSNQGGTLLSEASLVLNSASLDNQSGQIEAIGDIAIEVDDYINNQSGLLRSGQTLTLTSTSVDNRNTQAVDSNNTPIQGIEGQSVHITADQIDNSTGAMRADNALAIIGSGTLNNSQGKLSSAGTLNIADRLANVNSNVAGKTLAVTNTGGTIIAGSGIASADLNIDSNSLTGDGKVLSKGDINTKLISDYTHTGEWQADGNATFETTGTLTNQAKLLAGNTLNITAGTLDNQAMGEIVGTTLHLNATDTHTLTNRGLIDGSDTFIDTVTLNNIGTGRIYGDHVAIAATTLLNDMETVNGVTQAAVIAARDRLDIGATTITNREHALLFSAGDMAIGGSLDSNHEATVATGQPQATTLNNNSATIEALGDLYLNVANINNTNDHFMTTYGVVSESTTPARAVNMAGPTQSPAPAAGNTRKFQATNGAFTPIGALYNYDEVSFYTAGYTHMVANGIDTAYFLQFNSGTIVNETHVVNSDPGQILAGGAATIVATNLLNDNSKIIIGGALDDNHVTNISNQETFGTRSSQYTGQNSLIYPRSSASYSRVLIYAPVDTAPVTQTINLGTSSYLSNMAHNGTGTTITPLTTNGISQTAESAGTVTLPNNSLFQTNPNPANGYYVETDPRFANYRSWLSSDYMLSALALDPALMQKRLGDGFYEQKLIREQVAQLTGRRFLTGYADDEAQYQAIMTNGVTFAQAHQLVPGVALSAAQVAQLTSDIVWLVEKTVTLADGSTVQALVPQVYAKLREGDLDGNGSLISADSVNFNLTSNLTNSGTIAGRSVISLTADNINNLGGRITANNTRLTARTDINNLGGSIQGEDSLTLNAARDINVASTTKSNRMTYDAAAGNKTVRVDVSRTNIDRVAGLYVSNPNGILVASADNDINLQGAVISNAGTNGTTVIDANHDLKLGTVATSSNNSYVRDARNYQKNSSTEEVGTAIQTDGDLSLNAGNNLTARAADVTSTNGALNVTANNDITIEAGKATYASESASYKKKSGTFSSKSKTRRDTTNGTDVISSTFSGNNVNIAAGNNLIFKASNIVGTNDVNLDAGNNVTLTTEQATHDETHYSKTKKSGFTASSTSIGYGSSKLTNTNDSQQVTNVGSTVGSVEGDVNINAGLNSNKGTYNQTGSDVLTPQGDINIVAQKVDITAATDTYANQQSMKYKQTGITLAISNPVISAIQTAQQMSKAAGKTDDPRMQALAAGTAALAVNNAYDAVKAGNTPKLDEHGLEVLDANGKNTAENPANQVGGINVNLSIGTAKSSNKTIQTSTTAKSSTLNAGGDISISAVRPELVEGQISEAGNINVIGSQIRAVNDVTLKADDQINLLAAQNVDTLNSKNKNSSASVGVSVGTTSGFAVTASASKGKGKANGTDVTWTETQIQSGNGTGDKVTLQSGTDTNIKGAQVTGNQVVANVGTSGQGNLNIESLQDTSTYKSKQSSAGISVSVPIGAGSYGGSISASNSKTKSDYASVNEQSGIMAGDGGFQVNVNGNTDLTGAVVASTDKAIQDNANSLTTQTLTTSNIGNKAEYEGNASSFSAGVGQHTAANGDVKNTPSASAGIASKEDSASSITVSGISGGAVNITDNTTQQTKTGKDAITTVATLNRDVQTQLTTDAQGNTTAIAVDSNGNNLAGTLTPIFDKEQVQRELDAQIQITQAFSQVAPKAVGDYAGNKVKELVVKAQEAHLAGDETTATQLLNDAEKWGDGGIYRVALHAATGGLTGNLEGAIGAGTSAVTIPMIGEELAKLDIPATLKQALVMATAAAIGGATGGTAGAGASLSEVANNYLSHQENLDREALRKNKADDNCDTACEQKLVSLDALDQQRDAEFHGACDGALSGTPGCADATRDLYAKLGTFATPEARKAATDPDASAFNTAHKDELQSYLDLIKTANSEVRTSIEGKVRDPSKYNPDPYGFIDKDNVQNTYLVMKFGTEALTIANTYVDGEYWFTDNAARNGMLNKPDYVSGLMMTHMDAAAETKHKKDDELAGTNTPYQPIDRFTLSYAPTDGFLKDLGGTAVSKTGIDTPPILALREQLESIQASGKEVYWMAHSRGGEDFAQASAGSGVQDLSKNFIVFHAGANTQFMTEPILDTKRIRTYGDGDGYRDAPNDLVPQIVGLRALTNPLNLVRSLVALPCVFLCSPEDSPHTLPYNWNNLQKE